MKLLLFFPTLLGLLISSFSSIAQDNAVKTSTDPFANGRYLLSLQRNVAYGTYKYVDDEGETISKSNSFRLRADNTWFIHKGFGAGIRLDYTSTGSHFGTVDYLNRDWMVYATASYGKHISDKFNLYTTWGIGYGSGKSIDNNGSITIEDKRNQFGYFGKIGAPIQLSGSTTYLTPQIGMDFLTVKYDDNDEKDKINEFFIGLKLESSLSCPETSCSPSFSTGMYDAGSSYLGYTTRGLYTTGKVKYEYQGTVTDEEKFSGMDLMGEYIYFPIKNLGVGASVGFSSDVEKSGTDYKFTNQKTKIHPQVLYHLPVKGLLNNAYVQVNGVINMQKQESTYGSISNTQKYTTTGFAAGVGYDHFFARRTALSGFAGYQWLTEKDKTTDEKFKERGFYTSGGVKWFF